MTTDLLSNLLTTIRNAVKIKKPYVEVPYSENNYKIVKILENQGLLNGATSLRRNPIFYNIFYYSLLSNNKKKFLLPSFVSHESLFRKKKSAHTICFEKNKNRKRNTDELLFVTSTEKQTTRLPFLITTSEQDVINQNIVKNKVNSKNNPQVSQTFTQNQKKIQEKNKNITNGTSFPQFAPNNSENRLDSSLFPFKLRPKIISNITNEDNHLYSKFETSKNSKTVSNQKNVSLMFPKSFDDIFPSITTLQVGTENFGKKSFFGKTLLNFYYLYHNKDFYQHNYENNFSKQKKSKKSILIALKFTKNNTQSVIHYLKRISKPSLRRYSKHPIPKILNGLGTAIISTSSGIMTDQDARFKKLGGEILAEIW